MLQLAMRVHTNQLIRSHLLQISLLSIKLIYLRSEQCVRCDLGHVIFTVTLYQYLSCRCLLLDGHETERQCSFRSLQLVCKLHTKQAFCPTLSGLRFAMLSCLGPEELKTPLYNSAATDYALIVK